MGKTYKGYIYIYIYIISIVTHYNSNKSILTTCIAKHENAHTINNDLGIYPLFYTLQNNYPPSSKGKPRLYTNEVK